MDVPRPTGGGHITLLPPHGSATAAAAVATAAANSPAAAGPAQKALFAGCPAAFSGDDAPAVGPAPRSVRRRRRHRAAAVVILFRATGDAPILKQAKFKIAASERFAKVVDFLLRQLHRDTLFVYVNSAFAPSPDELIADLFNNFAVDGKLVVNYASSQAWG
eukprot:SM000211S06655  [mRNA]  locus=s211:122898:124147:- [translate_table: standard]